MATPLKRLRLCAPQRLLAPISSRQSLRTFSDTTSCRQQSNPFDQPSSQSSTDEDLAKYRSEDLTSLAHRELEQHRELREMVRLAAWEMPLLAELSKAFEPPTKTQVLRWRYTTYMGEAHPASRKVVVEFEPAHLPDMTEQQIQKLLKLAGARYNPTKSIIKMSCESFETQAQNKRYLADTVNKMISEAKDANADTFEDIPLDLRHHKPPNIPKYPKAWILTPERKKQLEDARRVKLLEEGQKVESDRIVSGARLIEQNWERFAEQASTPVLVESRSSSNRRQTGQNQQRPQR